MPPRRVFIATPVYTGKVSMAYTISLLNTFKWSVTNRPDVELDVIYTKFDAIVQKSRNYFIAHALANNADDIIFIDDDIEWDPKWIFKLLDYPVDVVSGMYRKKFDHVEEYPFLPIKNENCDWFPPPVDPQTGLVQVLGVPTGFLRLSRKAMKALWDVSEVYMNGEIGEERAIFDIEIRDGIMYSEDFVMCQKLAKLGINAWVDSQMTCNHEGLKSFKGAFGDWLSNRACKSTQNS
jgi:hypothetical protein